MPGTTYVGLVLEHQSSGSPFYKSTITWNGSRWDLTMTNGTVLVFGDNLPLQEILDRHGNSLKVLHKAGRRRRPVRRHVRAAGLNVK